MSIDFQTIPNSAVPDYPVTLALPTTEMVSDQPMVRKETYRKKLARPNLVGPKQKKVVSTRPRAAKPKRGTVQKEKRDIGLDFRRLGDPRELDPEYFKVCLFHCSPLHTIDSVAKADPCRNAKRPYCDPAREWLPPPVPYWV
jgi:hypothetical protein